eukprot:NODE_6922_length_614_cov_46.895277_g6899_i0.p1 GENE.NODE_6922_length_614_cov_46.895277_g6899_i0~~NODE_6922_length_614_cov_46.895277_g6899_i0.p1  ORF type:complete len:145 (-),score=2.68 NODE_6922_length_614_cov_46.895277_g6899_i0:119-553(-)
MLGKCVVAPAFPSSVEHLPPISSNRIILKDDSSYWKKDTSFFARLARQPQHNEGPENAARTLNQDNQHQLTPVGTTPVMRFILFIRFLVVAMIECILRWYRPDKATRPPASRPELLPRQLPAANPTAYSGSSIVPNDHLRFRQR